MPTSDVVLLPLCIGLALIGVIVAGVAWRKGSRGRVAQGVGIALAPIALYLTGLLRLLWDGVVAVIGWATSIVFSPSMWLGIALLGLCVVLWVVGGVLTRRGAGTADRAVGAAGTKPGVGGRTGAASVPATKSTSARKTPGTGKATAADIDPELAEIEAILKDRGIN